MLNKSSGIDFDREVFAHPQSSNTAPSATGATGLMVFLIIVAAVVFLGYKLLPQIGNSSNPGDAPAMADIDRRLSEIESRLEKLEARTVVVVPARKESVPEQKEAVPSPKPAVRTVYQVSSASPQEPQQRAGPVSDPSTAQRISVLQQRVGALESDQQSTREDLEANRDKLTRMAGDVGNHEVEILRNQDQLNEFLSRTEMEAIPFELLRGSNPQPVGPVSFVLKSANAKTQRYTVCVYVQPSCFELKDRTVNEVVQFVVARNSTPLEVIATHIVKDEITGYLEVPRDQSAH